MSTTTQITSLGDVLDLTGVFGDFAADYDTEAVTIAYTEALQDAAQQIAPSVTVHRNGMVFAEVPDADAAREIPWTEIAAEIDITPILAAHER